MKFVLLIISFLFIAECSNAQDSLNKKYSLHWQTTFISQYSPAFHAPYSGFNSFLPNEPVRTSFTTTLFAVYKPFKNTYFTFNPEMAGGKGLSKTTGVAGFPNGEVYRVGNPAPQLFVARLYAEQRFPLSNKTQSVEDDLNQIQEKTNKEYISVIAGKFSLTDFFDNSEISHDPRTQFMNWALMGSGAWDYPANVRGYTFGVVVQAHFKDWALRFAETAVPIEANGTSMQWKGSDAGGTVLELEKKHLFYKSEQRFSSMHFGTFINKARMGNYEESLNNYLLNPQAVAPDITDSRQFGRSKYGFYFSMDNHFKSIHHFIKASWSDGLNETWAFTEIDRSFASGLSFDGGLWKRKKDNAGIALVVNGIGKAHRTYLASGGYGFIIGDGALNYGTENIIEAYYSWNPWKKVFISPDYQLIINPAYNKDRGPAQAIALRLHVELK